MSFCQFSPEWSICEIVNTIIASIGLPIVTILGTHGLRQFFKRSKMKKIFKSLFICAVLCSVIILLSVIAASVLCSKSLKSESFVFQVFIVIFYHLLSLVLSLTLYGRLWFVFKNSLYEINKYYFCTLLSLTLITSIIGIIGASLYLLVIYQADVLGDFTNMAQNAERAVSVSFTGHLGYIILSIWGLILFTRNLDSLVLIQSKATVTDATHNVVRVELDHTQLELIYQQTKYVVLLSIAMITSILFYILILIQGYFGEEYIKLYSFQIDTIFESIDVITNVICLYFQFSFADKYYSKFCKCSNRFKNRMQIKHLERAKSKTNTISIPTHSPTNTNPHVFPRTPSTNTSVVIEETNDDIDK